MVPLMSFHVNKCLSIMIKSLNHGSFDVVNGLNHGSFDVVNGLNHGSFDKSSCPDTPNLTL